MATLRIKRVLKWTALSFLFLIAVLAVHIYIVTRPKVDGNTRVMARIDVHQALSRQDGDAITAWLYQQKGVDHVLCNNENKIVIFTYSPLNANADDIAANFRSSLHYPNAVRYAPTEKELQGGCPVASSSFIYKAYAYFKHNF